MANSAERGVILNTNKQAIKSDERHQRDNQTHKSKIN